MSSKYRYVWPKDPRPGNPQRWSSLWRFADVFTGKGPDIYVEKRRPKTETVCPESVRPKTVATTATARSVVINHGCNSRPGPGHDYSHDYVYNSCSHNHNHNHNHPGYGRGHGYDSNATVNATVIINREPRCKGKGKDKDRWRGGFEDGGIGGDWSLWGREHLKDCRRIHCDECDRIHAQERRDNVFSPRHPDERYDFRTRTYRIPDEGTWSRKVYCDEPGHIVPRRYWDRYGREYPAGMWHDKIHGVHADRCRRKVYFC
ncbi:hypothetical protein BDV06DRAFT_170276 [Aspergillus oleicola]